MSADIHSASHDAKQMEETRELPTFVQDIEHRNHENSESRSTKSVDEETPDSSLVEYRPLRFFVLFFGLALTVFCIGLDNTIVATVIPHITDVFSSLEDIGWYGSAFLLAMTAVQPTYGKVYSFLAVKWTYLASLLFFELASVICAAATSSRMLIVGRALAGVGSAGLFGGGFTIIGLSVPIKKRPIFIAVLASLYGFSSVIGPLLGGALTDRVSWRWCFWINLPFGGVALLCVGFFFREPKREETNITFTEKLRELDPLGAMLLVCSMVCLFLALQWGGSKLAWGDPRVWGCILAFGLLLILFALVQLRQQKRATIPSHVIGQRTVLFSALFIFFTGIAFYVHVYYLAFYFQAVRSTSAEESGIRTIPYLLSNTIFSFVAGGIITAQGYFTPFVWLGSAIITIGSGLIYTLDQYSTPAQWIGYQVVAGIGMGLSIQVPFTAVQVVMDEKDAPTAISFIIFMQQLGGAIAVSVAQNLFQTKLIQEMLILVPSLDPTTVLATGASQIADNFPLALLAPIIDSYRIALSRTFILPIVAGGIAFLCSWGLELRSVKAPRV